MLEHYNKSINPSAFIGGPKAEGPITGLRAVAVDLDATADSLSQAIGMLETTLTQMGVLAPAPPTGATQSTAAPFAAGYRASTPNDLEVTRQRIRGSITAIEDLRQRLDS